MSNKLLPVSRRELIRRLSKLGFVGPYPGAGHEYMTRGLVDVHIPNPMAAILALAFCRRSSSELGISREEWLEAS